MTKLRSSAIRLQEHERGTWDDCDDSSHVRDKSRGQRAYKKRDELKMPVTPFDRPANRFVYLIRSLPLAREHARDTRLR